MINFYNQVPSVYPSASRDFQYMSWLINIVLNSVKHNIDDIYEIPSADSDPRLTELLALTLGFKVRRNYDNKQLVALTAALPRIIRYKGTKKAVEMAANALVIAAGTVSDVTVISNGAHLDVVLPKELTDITLFQDLLDYILPAGTTCRIIRKNEDKKKVTDLLIRHTDRLRLLVTDDFALDGSSAKSTGLSGMYDFENNDKILDFSSNIVTLGVEGTEEVLKPNIGLLQNAVIPAFADSASVVIQDNTNALYSTRGITESGTVLKDALMSKDGKQLEAKKTVQEI